LFDHKAKLEEEKNLLGLFLSGHPLEGFASPVNWDRLANGDAFETAGVVTSHKVITTKKGDEMAFINIDTLEGNRRIVVFPKEYAHVQGQIDKDIIVKLTLTKQYEARTDEYSYIVKKINVPKRINKTVLASMKAREGETI
jgi:DNA polymerase-3 subunit alpha